MQAFFTGFALNKPMIDVVRALRGRIALGCLTNTVRRNGATELFGLDAALFDVVVASCEVGMRKPDPAIYKLTGRRLGVGPSDADLASDLLRGSEQDTDQPRGDSGFDVRHVVVKEHDSSPSGVAAKPRIATNQLARLLIPASPSVRTKGDHQGRRVAARSEARTREAAGRAAPALTD